MKLIEQALLLLICLYSRVICLSVCLELFLSDRETGRLYAEFVFVQHIINQCNALSGDRKVIAVRHKLADLLDSVICIGLQVLFHQTVITGFIGFQRSLRVSAACGENLRCLRWDMTARNLIHNQALILGRNIAPRFKFSQRVCHFVGIQGSADNNRGNGLFIQSFRNLQSQGIHAFNGTFCTEGTDQRLISAVRRLKLFFAEKTFSFFC